MILPCTTRQAGHPHQFRLESTNEHRRHANPPPPSHIKDTKNGVLFNGETGSNSYQNCCSKNSAAARRRADQQNWNFAAVSLPHESSTSTCNCSGSFELRKEFSCSPAPSCHSHPQPTDLSAGWCAQTLLCRRSPLLLLLSVCYSHVHSATCNG